MSAILIPGIAPNHPIGLQINLNTSSLIEVLLFANTPNYVYKNFRREDSVKSLSSKYSTEQLITEYQKHISAINQSAEDVVTAYAILIGLTFFDYPKALEAIHKLNLSPLTWGNEIKEIFVANAKTTNVFNVSPQVSLNPPFNTISSGNIQTQRVTPKTGKQHD